MGVGADSASSHDDFWDTFHATRPDMTAVNALIHAGAPDWAIHEAMCAAREGRVPDIEPRRTRRNPGQRSRWIASGLGTGGAAMIIRREDEVDDE